MVSYDLFLINTFFKIITNNTTQCRCFESFNKQQYYEENRLLIVIAITLCLPTWFCDIEYSANIVSLFYWLQTCDHFSWGSIKRHMSPTHCTSNGTCSTMLIWWNVVGCKGCDAHYNEIIKPFVGYWLNKIYYG